MNKITHFEIPATNPEKLADFFKKTFNWKINKWGEMDYWLTDNGDAKVPGINGAITKRGGNNSTVVNTIDVDNIDDILKKIAANGGQVLTPKQPIPTVGWFAYFKDPEGTVHGVMQPDAKAK